MESSKQYIIYKIFLMWEDLVKMLCVSYFANLLSHLFIILWFSATIFVFLYHKLDQTNEP